MRLLGWLTLIGLVGLAFVVTMMVRLNRLTTAARAVERHYVVQPGDTLSGIADRHRTTVEALAAANRIKADQIEVGQRLSVKGKARPASARPKPRPRARLAPEPRPKPTRKRSPIEEPDAIIDDHMSDVVVESLVALVRLRGYRCDSVSGAVPSVFRAHRFTLNCDQFRYAYVIEDRGGHWIVRVK